MGEDKMKVLLVCPSNTLFMPYLENYTTIFSDNNISYDTLLWNRFGYEERAQYQFTDKKKVIEEIYLIILSLANMSKKYWIIQIMIK